MEEAFFFENNGKHLFAISHSPERNGTSQKSGIVFCHPFGEEKQMSYRVFVRYARELCEKGFHVLRFDSSGYGDSEGLFEDATIETQVADTRKAIGLMKKRLGIHKVGLLGLRLGATVAALTAEQDDRVHRLILWSPVVKGEEYLRALFRKRMYAALASNLGTISREQLLEELQTKGSIEVEGHRLTRQVYQQLLRTDLTVQVANFKHAVLLSVMADRSARGGLEALSEVYTRCGANCELKTIAERDFCDKQALFGWYFPEKLFRVTTDWLEGRSM